ncbi:MAG TPA: hypothetical protein DCF70_06295 [Treponema sp.]|nr:hypothetical protein [Treponema sp.]
MQIKKCLVKTIKIQFVLVLLMLVTDAFAQKSPFNQVLEWKADKNAFYYRLEIQKNGSGKSDFIQTEKNTARVQLEPGSYRYRVYVYDFLGRQSSVNEWTDFEVLKANHPQFKRPPKDVILPEDRDYFEVPLDVNGVSANSTVTVVNEETGYELKGTLNFKNPEATESETNRATNANFGYVRPGTYFIRVTNPSGFSAKSESFRIAFAEPVAPPEPEPQPEPIAPPPAPEPQPQPEPVAPLPVTQPQPEPIAPQATPVQIIQQVAEPVEITEELVEEKLDIDMKLIPGEVRVKASDSDKVKLQKKRNNAINQLLTESEGQDIVVVGKGRSHSEWGFYLKDYFPIQKMSNHSYNFMGAGLSYAFHILPHSRMDFGLIVTADAHTVMANLDYIEEWYEFNLLGGIFLDFAMSDAFSFLPKVTGGIQTDTVRSNVTSTRHYKSPALEVDLGFKFSPEKIGLDGVSVELAPFYLASFEDSGNRAEFLGIRLGLLYHTGSKKAIKATRVKRSAVKQDAPEQAQEKEQ